MTKRPTPGPLTDEQKRYLAAKIGALLIPNVDFPRGVYNMEDRKLPVGPSLGARINKLMKTPLDGLRGELGGTTITVEITTERQGEQDDPDALRYATSDYDEFRAWFYTLLRRNGVYPLPPVAMPPDHTTTVKVVRINPSLSKPAYINRKPYRR